MADAFFVHAAQVVELGHCTMFDELVGHTDTAHVGLVTIVGHKLQHGAAHASADDAVFHRDDALEVLSYLV